MRILIVLGLLWLASSGQVLGQPPAQRSRKQPDIPHLSHVQVAYLQYCGGCHGIQGVSAPKEVPTLRAQVGRFLCTADARDYVVRLPNIALAPLSDQLLTDLLNFVVFGMGGTASVPAGAVPYDPVEVKLLRRQPITANLEQYRQRVLDGLGKGCARAAVKGREVG